MLDAGDLPNASLPTPFSVRLSSSLCLSCEQRPSLPKDTLSLLQGATQTPKASGTPFCTGDVVLQIAYTF